MANHAIGTTLSIGGTLVGEITSITPPAIAVDPIEITNLDSPESYREFIPGLKDAGEIPVSGFFAPGNAGQTAIKTSMDNKTIDTFVITMTSIGAAITVQGFISNYAPGEATTDGAYPFEATIKVTGKPTQGLTASTGASNIVLTGTSGALTPTFATAKRKYSWVYITLASITVTVTAASHTIKLYVDDVFVQNLTSAAASGAIAIGAAEAKKIDVVCWEANKTPVIYTIMAARTS